MPIRIASHLYRNRHGGFYFRLLIPIDLRATAQRRECRFSLNTEQRAQAIIAAHHLIAERHTLFDDLRRMSENNQHPTSDYFAKWAEAKRENINLKARIDELETQLLDAHHQLTQSVPRSRAETVIRNAYVRGQLTGKQDLEEALVFPWPPAKTVLFSTLRDKYLKNLTSRPRGARKPPPTAKTLEAYEKDISAFVFIMGDLRIGEIDRETAGEFFNVLRRLPANISRKKEYRDKTASELIAMNAPSQSEENASKKAERISAMFLWALKEKRTWGIDANPFEGFGQSDGNQSTRRPFTPDELMGLFNHPDFQKRRFRTTYNFWLIPLAMFTGARLGELAQLDLKDFVTVENIPCIDINDIEATDTTQDAEGRKKRVKTKNAKRLVPIHRELIRIGLLRHVEAMRARGERYLFPELSRTRRDGPGHAASNWFQRFRAKVGITAKQATVFHSFRHLFITTILDAEVPPHMLAPVVGHESELITGKVYWNKKDATKRQPTVEAFALPDHVTAMIPRVEDVTWTAAPGPQRQRAVKAL